MAAGLFGNIYDTQTAQQNQLAAEARGTGQGWTAMTTAARELGGAIGSGVGKAFGGVTPQEQKMAELEKINSSMTDFDPTDPAQMKEMSSKLWTGGFYDEGMAMLKESYEMQKVDALMQYYKDQGDAAKSNAAAPPKRTPDTAPTQLEYDTLSSLVDENFDTSFFDWIQPDIPADKSKKWVIGFIHDYARVTDLTAGQVVDGIKDGSIKLNTAIPGVSTPTSPTEPAGSSADPGITLPQR
tara:strand:- start:484 stop:1203 length:720 start_codon:yes stop_codon:yes gene_type:complete